jgi:signal transduction histidine kinase
MLDLSKIEAGKLDVSPEVTWVEIMLEECVAEMRPAAGAKGIDMRIQAEPDLRAWADPRRLRQVLLNLLSNAIKFTPQGGGITIEARQAGDSVELVVTDSGIGIEPEHLEMIFDEFTQIDSRLSREAPGSGLGLPLSRSLVEIMGGSISVESSPGAGSSFTVRLPAAALESAVV